MGTFPPIVSGAGRPDVWFCSLTTLSRFLTSAVLILALGLSACWQEVWRKLYAGTETIPGGDLFATSWASPRDSGLVAVALVSPDSAQFGGFRVVDKFPAEMWFDVTLQLPSQSGVLGDSLSLRYEADEQTVEHGGRTFDVSHSPLFVIPFGSFDAKLYHLPTDSAAVRLSAATKRELKRRFPTSVQLGPQNPLLVLEVKDRAAISVEMSGSGSGGGTSAYR